MLACECCYLEWLMVAVAKGMVSDFFPRFVDRYSLLQLRVLSNKGG